MANRCLVVSLTYPPDSELCPRLRYVDHKSAESSMDGATPEVTADKWRKALDNVVGTCETRYIASECIDKVLLGQLQRPGINMAARALGFRRSPIGFQVVAESAQLLCS